MQAQFEKARWMQDSDGAWVCFNLPDRLARSLIDGIRPGRRYDLDVRQHRERRSLDANAYCWVLIGKLAAHYGVPPDEVYRMQIRNIGGNYEVIPVREDAAEKWPAVWGGGGLGYMAEHMGASKVPGYVNFRCYYGSHVYDTRQMSQLIDAVVQDCKDAGIETWSEERLDLLKEGWREQADKGA